MANQRIQLTEQDLHMLVEDAVREYMIQEGLWDTLKGGAQALGQMAGRGLQKAGGNVANAASGAMNRMGQAVGNAYNTAAKILTIGFNLLHT